VCVCVKDFKCTKDIHKNLQMKPRLGAMTFPFIVEGLKMEDFKPSVKLDLLVLDLMISG